MLVTSTGFTFHGPSKVPCAPLRVVNRPWKNCDTRVFEAGAVGSGESAVADQSARAWAAVYTGPFTGMVLLNVVPPGRVVTKCSEFPAAFN